MQPPRYVELMEGLGVSLPAHLLLSAVRDSPTASSLTCRRFSATLRTTFLNISTRRILEEAQWEGEEEGGEGEGCTGTQGTQGTSP